MGETVGILIALGAVGVMLLIVFIKSNLVICQPNEVLIFSGRKHTSPDGGRVGFRVIKGGRAFKFPIIESVSRMPLTTIPIEISISRALAKGIIPIHVEAIATVKIAGSESDGLSNAVERFLGKNIHEISRVAKETIEGSLRGVLAQMTPEEANGQRLELATQVSEDASSDLRRLGLVLDTLKIQNISDDHGYLEAIGREKNAEVVKNARVAEAQAEAEARQVAADAKRRGSIAEAEAEVLIVEAENKLRLRRAALQSESNQAEERAKLAGQIARTEEEQQLEERRIAMNRKKYEADIVVPAAADRRAAELKAVGEAARIIEDGKATAEAVKLLREQWQEGNTRDLFLIQMLPELLDKVTRVVADNLHVEKLTVLDSGNGGGGLPGHVRNLTGTVAALFEELKNTTGLDVSNLLMNGSKPKKDVIPKELAKR